jgi:hypothetical protein
MPPELWAEAARLGQDHGVYPVARALRISFITRCPILEQHRAGPPVEVPPELASVVGLVSMATVASVVWATKIVGDDDSDITGRRLRSR